MSCLIPGGLHDDRHRLRRERRKYQTVSGSLLSSRRKIHDFGTLSPSLFSGERDRFDLLLSSALSRPRPRSIRRFVDVGLGLFRRDPSLPRLGHRHRHSPLRHRADAKIHRRGLSNTLQVHLSRDFSAPMLTDAHFPSFSKT